MDRRRKLTPEAVREIREWYRQWSELLSMRAMARKHGVNTKSLLDAAQGETYRWVQ